MNKLRFLWDLTRGRRWIFLLALICQFTASFLAMLSPQVIRVFIDSVIGNQPFEVPAFIHEWVTSIGGASFLQQNLWIGALLIVGAGLLYVAFQFAYDTLAGNVGESIAKNTRDQIYTRLARLPYDYFVRTPSGDILQRCSSDIGEIQGLLTYDLMSISGAVIMVVLNLVMMLAIDPVLTVISLSLVPVMVFLNVVVKGRMSRAYDARKARADDLAGFMHNYVQGIRVVKAFGRQRYERGRFAKINHEASDAVRASEYAAAYYWPFFLSVLLAQTALVIISGIFRVGAGYSTVGSIVAFVTYTKSLMSQMGHFSYIFISITMAQVALNRLNDILGEPEEDFSGDTPGAPLTGEIAFEDVDFAYGEKKVLDKISFSVKPGQVVGILGKAGSGKSTLTQLLVRLYDYGGGSVRLNGKELKTLSRTYIRQNIGVVLQEPFLFSRSVAENIAMAVPEAGQGEVEAAARMACVDKDISSFKEGYATVVGEKGITVSGGQRQRIAIAQTIIRDCPVLILDDSLSAVDADTDRKIRAELKRNASGKTILLISHRIDTLRSADLILVMEGGQITQRGNHETLSKQDGLYRRIMEIQQADREAIA